MLFVSCSILTVSYVHVNRFKISMLHLKQDALCLFIPSLMCLIREINYFLELNLSTTYQGMCTLLLDNLFWLSLSVFVTCLLLVVVCMFFLQIV